MVSAAHDGYRHLPGRPVHHRSWTLGNCGLRVDDEISGSGRHVVVARWHLAPGCAVRVRADGARVSTPAGPVDVDISSTVPATVALVTARVATGFGQTGPAQVLACRVEASLPVRISTSWSRPAEGAR